MFLDSFSSKRAEKNVSPFFVGNGAVSEGFLGETFQFHVPSLLYLSFTAAESVRLESGRKNALACRKFSGFSEIRRCGTFIHDLEEG